MTWKTFISLLFILVLAGCGITPIHTLDEKLNKPNALRPIPEDKFRGEIPFHVNVVYAYAAWQQLDQAEVPSVPGIDTQSTLEVLPLAVFDYFTAGTGAAVTGFVTSFGSHDIEGDYRRSVRNRGVGLTANANTHYYLFDTRDGTATPEDVDHAWDQAHKVFESVYNRHGRCHVNFWTPEHGYYGARVQNARGQLKQVDFRCPHPIYPDGPYQLISLQAWGNPFDGIRGLGAVQARCWVLLPKGQAVPRDYRDCGEKLAARQRPYLPDTDLQLMELIITPTAADPTVFEVVGRFGDRVTVLPAPDGLMPQYREWLASQPYTVED